jgi:2-haloacid dehalogenase
MLVIFDIVGTLFSLEKVKNRFQDNGVRPELMELWLARVQQMSMAATLAGKYIPFKVLASCTLKQLFALENIHERYFDDILDTLEDIEPWDDAGECLRGLRTDGHRIAALTNCDSEEVERLLLRSGLKKELERVYSADIAKACKPHPALYELLFRTMFAAPYECCMVTAHEWDIFGAESLGMNTVYINRLEKQWPFPESPSGFMVSSLREVPRLISKVFGKPAGTQENTLSAQELKLHGEA